MSNPPTFNPPGMLWPDPALRGLVHDLWQQVGNVATCMGDMSPYPYSMPPDCAGPRALALADYQAIAMVAARDDLIVCLLALVIAAAVAGLWLGTRMERRRWVAG